MLNGPVTVRPDVLTRTLAISSGAVLKIRMHLCVARVVLSFQYQRPSSSIGGAKDADASLQTSPGAVTELGALATSNIVCTVWPASRVLTWRTEGLANPGDGAQGPTQVGVFGTQLVGQAVSGVPGLKLSVIRIGEFGPIGRP